MKNLRSLGLIVVLLAILPVTAMSQGFHRDCHDEQLRKLKEQLARMSPADRARHPELQAAADQSRKIIEDGENLNKNLAAAWDRVNRANLAALENDASFQRERERLKHQGESVDISKPAAVRQYQKDSREFNQRFHTRVTRAGLTDPEVDRANAAANKHQNVADNIEAEFLKKRIAAGISETERQKVITEAVTGVASDLGLNSDHLSVLTNNKAWSQAVAAYAVANSIAKNGVLAERLEFAIDLGMGKNPWDDSARVSVEVAARGLVGNMGLTHFGQWGGSADAVDLRNNMGPRTREAVSAGVSDALINLDHVGQFRRIYKSALEKHISSPPRVDRHSLTPRQPPIKSEPEADSKFGKYISSLAEGLKEAANEGGKVLWAWGAPKFK